MNEARKNITALQDMWNRGVEYACGEAHPFPFVDTVELRCLAYLLDVYRAYRHVAPLSRNIFWCCYSSDLSKYGMVAHGHFHAGIQLLLSFKLLFMDLLLSPFHQLLCVSLSVEKEEKCKENPTDERWKMHITIRELAIVTRSLFIKFWRKRLGV